MKLTVFDKINLFFNAYIAMFGNLIRFSSWSPFFNLAIFQLSGLALLAWVSMPGWKDLVYPILSIVLPSQSFHFPRYLLALPHIFSDFDNFILGPTAWVIFSAAAVFVLGGLCSGDKHRAREGYARAFRSYLPLLLIWFIELVLVFAVFKISTILMIEFIYGSPRRLFTLTIILQLVAFIPSAFLIYAIPGIILDRQGFFAAVGRSFKLSVKNFFLTYFIILIPGLVRLGFDILIKDFGPKIVFTLNPNLIIVLMALKIIAGIFVNLFILGAATYIYCKLTDRI